MNECMLYAFSQYANVRRTKLLCDKSWSGNRLLDVLCAHTIATTAAELLVYVPILSGRPLFNWFNCVVCVCAYACCICICLLIYVMRHQIIYSFGWVMLRWLPLCRPHRHDRMHFEYNKTMAMTTGRMNSKTCNTADRRYRFLTLFANRNGKREISRSQFAWHAFSWMTIDDMETIHSSECLLLFVTRKYHQQYYHETKISRIIGNRIILQLSGTITGFSISRSDKNSDKNISVCATWNCVLTACSRAEPLAECRHPHRLATKFDSSMRCDVPRQVREQKKNG